ncbi:Polyadenylate-binding protein RBP45 [Dichanthelium oligosanthes]|uniref:Polyadenylate-binding protein RBP45 n=1 Tax=Dichanthelium oligosanthes TaxID=888268 RepID=A0A1E5VN66_9POAL|nr:Polyadenylate-binding protein RBP45 [Dichanthelium oligosanthes]
MAPPHPLGWADAPPYHYHGTRKLWIGGLLHWMNEDYLYACFTWSPELLSLVIMRSKHTGQSEGFGFLNFADHTTATNILKSYNGQKMPNADRDFSLHWAAPQPPAPEKLPDQDSKLERASQQDAHTDGPAASDHAIFVGDLAFDVTEYMLHHLFKTRYPSVKSAKVIFDKLTGHSKGYGFVHFGDANEHVQAMAEMNGAYCSTRPMRIGPAPNKKSTYTYWPSNPRFNF